MHIVTLISDMGIKDHYVATIKATLLRNVKNIQIIDISHSVEAFNLSQAAYYLRNCIDDFPEGTVHIVAVDSEPIINFGSPELSSLPAILNYKKQFIVSNDNGLFNLLTKEDTFESFWHVDDILSNPQNLKFPAKNILVPIAIKILNKTPLDKFATKVNHFKRMIALNPIIETNLIKGNAQHIDVYGNIITNIDKTTFLRMGENVPFTIFFRRKEYYIDVISTTYGDVSPGERVAFFNNNDLLEIAINKGSNDKNGGASNLFGIETGDIIRIEFNPEGSKNSINDLF
jgi:S-adenosyl-L-methionine hydrolase (adenosine-forming)